jgi:hypothetical protein
VPKLQAEEQELAKDLARLRTQADLKRSSIKDEEKRIEDLQTAVEEVSFYKYFHDLLDLTDTLLHAHS